MIEETTEDQIIKDMVGREVDTAFERPLETSNEMILHVNEISTKSKLKKISFNLAKGEILGFFGLVGAGRTELAKAIYG